jgi:hypothetical protein
VGFAGVKITYLRRMNLIIENDRDRILLVCMHEAGHYILTKEMGFETTGISVKFERYGGHIGNSGFKNWNPYMDSLLKMKEFLEKRIKILYAGVIAECIDKEGNYDGQKAIIEWTIGGGRNDHSNIRELTRLIRDIDFPDTENEDDVNAQLKVIDDKLISDAGDIVFDRIQIIRSLANMLCDKVLDYGIEYKLTEEELNEIPSIRKLYLK